MPIPKTMLASVTSGEKDQASLQEILVPEIKPHEVLVQVKAAACNPSEWKCVERCPTEGAVLGCDFAGIVVAVGSEVPSSRVKLGDEVAGLVHGSAFPNGAFAEYVAAPSELLLPIPQTWSFEQAAQEPLVMYTASLCLYHALKLPSILSPTHNPIDIVVWGGASSLGQATIQLACLGGLNVIATASPRNFDLVKSLGAEYVFDYSEEATPKKIKELTQNRLTYAVDCIGEKGTNDQIAECIGELGGNVAIALPYEQKRKDIKNHFVLVYHLFGKDLTNPFPAQCDMAQYEHRVQANKVLTQALLSGKYQPGPIEILPNGLESVNEGMKRLKKGEVRGKKLVHRILDTPQLKVRGVAV